MSGGTNMWCSNCEDITECKAVPAAHITGNNADYQQTKYMVNGPDINMFQRGRRCLTCDYEFVTLEIREDFVTELIMLRNSLRAIKKNSENYIKESSAASKTLRELTKSLSVLNALNGDYDD